MSGRSNGEEPGRGHAVTTRGRGSNSRSDGAPPLSSISIRRAGRGPALNRQGGVRSFRDSSSPAPPFFAYPSGQYYVRVGPPTHTALRTVGPLLTDVRQGAAGASANCFGERSWEGRDVMLCAGACWGPACPLRSRGRTDTLHAPPPPGCNTRDTNGRVGPAAPLCGSVGQEGPRRPSGNLDWPDSQGPARSVGEMGRGWCGERGPCWPGGEGTSRTRTWPTRAGVRERGDTASRGGGVAGAARAGQQRTCLRVAVLFLYDCQLRRPGRLTRLPPPPTPTTPPSESIPVHVRIWAWQVVGRRWAAACVGVWNGEGRVER